MSAVVFLITTIAFAVGYLKNRVANIALVKFMADKGYTPPTEEESEACCREAVKQLFRVR